MFSITFPKQTTQRYWNIHYEYLLKIFEYLGCSIVFQEGLDLHSTAFVCGIDGKEFIFDFSDSSEVNSDLLSRDKKIFKFHTTRENLDKVIPFSPVSFYNWQQYWDLQSQIQYKHGFYVANRQRAYGNAIERRSRVKTLLESKFGAILKTGFIPQEQFWQEINELMVSVCVPGQNNNMVDRGQFQYFGFGCCTISPFLPEVLPFNTIIESNVHYLECFSDYSNLVDIIEFASKHRDICIDIGRKAKQLFLKTSTPEKLGVWIREQL